MTTTRKLMPTRTEMATAQSLLKAAGWEHVGTAMVDDARKDGVEDFGLLYARGAEQFWLNYKTIRPLLMPR